MAAACSIRKGPNSVLPPVHQLPAVSPVSLGRSGLLGDVDPKREVELVEFTARRKRDYDWQRLLYGRTNNLLQGLLPPEKQGLF